MKTEHSKFRITITLWCLGTAGLVPAGAIAQEVSDDWQFAATVYAWLPDIGGQTQFPLGGGGSIDVDVSTILDSLKMTFQGSLEVHKGRWGGLTDLVYLNVGESKSETRAIEIGGQPLPASVAAEARFDLKSTIWTIAASYRGVATPAMTLDWLAGTRLANVDQTIDWEFTGTFGSTTPPPLTGGNSASTDQWDFIAGAKGRYAFGADHNWVMPFYFDIGAGDSDLTWQAMLGFGYSFNWGDLGVAWRYLDYDLDPPIADMNFNGPAFGVAFRW